MKLTFLLVALTACGAFAESPVPGGPAVDSLQSILVPGEDWQVAVEGLGFADGLSCDADGNLYFADLKGDNAGVYRLAPDGTKTKLAAGGKSGTRVGPDSRLYACGGKVLVAFDLKSGAKQTQIADNLGTNDLAVSKQGFVYITDTGKKQVTRVNVKTGEVAAADTGITAPNGIGLSPDHATLYVSDYGGTNVWALKVQPDGSLTDKKPLMTMKAPENKPSVTAGDGLTVDSAGRVYVTTALGVQVFDPKGQHLGTIKIPEGKTPGGKGPLVSAGFGGKDLDHLYIACGDKLYRRKTKVKGAAAPAAR